MLYEIFVGLVVTILGSVLIYFYKKRQLYAVIPKMYEFSYFSDNGTVSELKIFNKGANIEEDILLEINADKTLELLSASTNSITLNGNQIKIPRLFSGDEASMILSIDNGKLSSEDLLSITSKNVKGSIFNDILDVPPSTRSIIYTLLGISSLVAIFYFNLPSKIIDLNFMKKTESNKLKIKGWSSLDKYFSSDLSDSYSEEEFPIRLVEINETGKLIKAKYEIINKSAIPIEVTASDTMVDIHKTSNNKRWHNYYENTIIQPLSKVNLEIESLKNTDTNITFEFSIKFGKDFIYGLKHTIYSKPYHELTDKEKRKILVGKWKSHVRGTKWLLIEEYKEDGTYEMYLWYSQLKNRLLQHTTGLWDIRNNFLYIKNISDGKKLLTFKSPNEIYNITDKQIVMLMHISDRDFKTTKIKLPDDFKIFSNLTDKQIREKIIGMWEENNNKLFYKIYNYKKDGNVTMNLYLNKAKTVKLLTAKAKWEIKNRILNYKIINSNSEHNMSISNSKDSIIIDINDKNISYYNYRGIKTLKYKLRSRSD